jgi:hypothetical protein
VDDQVSVPYLASGLRVNTTPENSWPAPSSVPTMGGSFGGTEFPPVSTLSDPTTHGMNSVFINQPSLQVWEFPLRISHPASLVASLMIDVLHKQRRLRTEGVTGTALTGPSQPTLRALLQPENSSPVHPLTRTISEMMRAINFRGFAERIGTMFVIYPVFRYVRSQFPSLAAMFLDDYPSMPPKPVRKPNTFVSTTY